MLKNCLFIILAAFMMPAFAASLMSHEKFVHLTYEEQKKIVIATMELVVEMESKYKHEVKTSGFNSERYRRYTEFMKSVSSLLLPSAYAAPVKNVRYGQYLNEFTTILNQRNRCIYGGWVSEMRGNFCTHPLNTQFRNIYQTEGGCTGSSNQITCNPAIFGFKNVGSKTLFCVPAGVSGADNTSRDCMAKALANPQESGASSREQRIANMIEGISRNPNDANAVFNFLVKACACDSRTTPQISQHYSNYMRPHQTCYAILKMMSEVTPQCQINNQPLMDTNQTQFLSSIKSILSEAEYKSSDVGSAYVRKIQDLRSSSPEFKASETAICGSAQGPGGGAETTTPQCVNRKTVPGNEFCCEAGKVPNAAKTDCVPDPNGGSETNDGGVTVTTTTPDTTTTTTTPDTTTTTPDTTTTTTTTPDTTTTTPDTTTTTTTTTECTPPQEGKEFIGGQCRDKCAEPTPMRNATSFACEACPADKEFAGGECRVKCADPTPQRNSETFACEAATDESDDDDNSSDVTISLSVTNKDSNTSTVKVTLNPADTNKTPYTIIWFSRGTKRPSTFPGSTARPTPETPMTLTEDTTPEPTTTTTPGETTEQGDPATTTTPGATTTPPDTTVRKPGENETDLNRDNFWGPLDAPRQNNDYEVCARLIKDNAKVSDSCVKIPMKPIATPRGNGGNPFQFPQMGPTRGGPSDAIFRGIR